MLSKRYNHRVRCSARAVVEAQAGVCRDLSLGGLFFLGPKFQTGRVVDVRLELQPAPGQPAKEIEATAVARYNHTYPEGTGTGFKFIRLASSDLAFLKEYVDNITQP